MLSSLQSHAAVAVLLLVILEPQAGPNSSRFHPNYEVSRKARYTYREYFFEVVLALPLPPSMLFKFVYCKNVKMSSSQIIKSIHLYSTKTYRSKVMASQQQSYTIWSPQDTVKDVADSLGIGNISDDVLRSLAMDVEYRILEIVEQAVKFKRHAKREILTTDDIARALRVLNVEPLYGYQDGSARCKDVSFSKVNASGGQTLFYLNDEEVDFDKLINEPLPKVPRLPTFTTHWLAIEGVQPTIPQNPS